MRKIKLNEIYITTFNKEFIPVEHIRGEFRSIRRVNMWADPNQREESRFLDKDGNRIRKSKLSHIKGEDPPKKPKSTI